MYSAFSKLVAKTPTLFPIFFDTSLRDGIQAAKKCEYTLSKKIDIFQKIMNQYNPQSLEIGSIVSPKIMPIMEDTLEFHKEINSILQSSTVNPMNPNIYVVVPNTNTLATAMDHGVQHYSFLTSVSEYFQYRNMRKTIKQTKDDFAKSMEMIKNPNSKKKLYISCINQCPIAGRIDNDWIVHELLDYHKKFAFDEFCLSDTCGTITYDDFEYIVDSITYFGLQSSKISVHLHVSPKNTDNIKQILKYCFRNKINKFDVSVLNTGGCSVTMRKDDLYPNMTYEMVYEAFVKYIDYENEREKETV
jgi:hydroxymethylglutaryl-CoA lyase